MKKVLSVMGLMVAPLLFVTIGALPHLAAILIILLTTPVGTELFPAAAIIAFGILFATSVALVAVAA